MRLNGWGDNVYNTKKASLSHKVRYNRWRSLIFIKYFLVGHDETSLCLSDTEQQSKPNLGEKDNT